MCEKNEMNNCIMSGHTIAGSKLFVIAEAVR